MYESAPALSETCPVAFTEVCPFSLPSPSFTSRWRVEIARRSTMLMVPAIAWVLNSAVALRITSMRSINSGESDSSEKPGGVGSPFRRICV